MITGKNYDQMKILAQILLPILGTLGFVLAYLWNFPSVKDFLGSIIVVITLLNVFLHISQAKYNKEISRGGVLMVVETEEGELFTLELADDPEVLKTKREVRFDIQNEWKDLGDLAA